MIQSFGTRKRVAELKFPHPVSRIKHTCSIINRPSTICRKPLSKSNKVRSPGLVFRSFPPEIRLLIYERALKWNGKTPVLLAALRGDPQLYSEALAVFYAINTFHLSARNASILDLPLSDPDIAATLQTVRSLAVEHTFQNYRLSGSGVFISTRSCVNAMKLSAHLPAFPHLTHLHIDFRPAWSRVCPHTTIVWPFPYAHHPPHLTTLRLSVGPCMIRRSAHQFQHLISNLNEGLGVPGRLERVTSAGPQCWVWNAENGGLLRWKRDEFGDEGRAEMLVRDLADQGVETLDSEEDVVGPTATVFMDDGQYVAWLNMRQEALRAAMEAITAH